MAKRRAVLREILALRESSGGGLGALEDFAASRPELGEAAGVRVYANLGEVRRTSGRDVSLWDRTEPGARLFLGPFARAIDMAGRLDGSLQIEADEISLAVSLDGSALRPESPASVLFAGGLDAREVLAPPPSTIATLRLDRSLLSYLREIDRILPRADAAAVKAGLSTADSLIGRHSLIEDLLPALGEPWDVFVLARDERVASDELWPRIELPAFVLVAPLENERARDLLMRGAFLITLISAGERSRGGKQPFRLRSRRIGGQTLLVARMADWREPTVPPTEYDVSPTLLFTETHAILSSTEDGALDMAGHLDQPMEKISGDLLRVDGAKVAVYLARNHDVIATNTVLNKGVTLREARTEARIFESIARALRLELRATSRQDGTTVFTGSLHRTER